jgi:hypothetical protein
MRISFASMVTGQVHHFGLLTDDMQAALKEAEDAVYT